MVSDELGNAAPSVEAYRDALMALCNSLPGNHLRMLQMHYAAPQQTINPEIFAQEVGYSNRSAVNLQYGLLAKRVCEILNLKLRFHIQALIIFVHSESATGKAATWIMRPQVAGALEQLGWVQKLTALPNRVPAKASEVLGSPHEQATDFNEWQMDVRRWLHSRHDFSTDLASNIVSFFELAFEHTRCPQRAWFGVHSSAVSLVVGGIFLAAICRSGENRGVWLLVDQQPPAFEGVEYWPVKSTRNSKFPLIWAHSSLLTVIPNLIQNARIWESFSAASEKILYTPRVASDRDAVQERRKKRRLTDFWGNRAVNLFPDEVDEKAEFREGAKRQVTVNAYERDPRAREACIQHYGARCFICGFSFGEFYGKVADGFIHVHHLRPLSEIGAEYTIDPIEELRPVCPNCHAVLHLHPKSPFSIQEVVELLHQRSAS